MPVSGMSRQSKNFNAGPHLALIAVQVIFGTWGIPAKIALRVITPFGLSAIRVAATAVLAAAIVLLILVLPQRPGRHPSSTDAVPA